jgi:hypothetical protein
VSIPNPLCGCNSGKAQYSNTPLPQPHLFDHEHEDDFDAPGEAHDVVFALFNHFHLQIIPERFWNLNAAVGLLVRFDDRHEQAR